MCWTIELISNLHSTPANQSNSLEIQFVFLLSLSSTFQKVQFRENKAKVIFPVKSMNLKRIASINLQYVYISRIVDYNRADDYSIDSVYFFLM